MTDETNGSRGVRNRRATHGEDMERRIRERAYAIWDEEGRPEGRALGHWLRARGNWSSREDREAEVKRLEADFSSLSERGLNASRGGLSSRAGSSKAVRRRAMTNVLSDTGRVADRRLLARRQLPVGRPDLSVRQSAPQGAARERAHQAAPARPLGHDAGPELHLRPPQPADQEARPRHDLHHRPRPRRPGLVANTYLEGTYSEVYPNISQDEEGMKRLFTQFSFPGGIPEPRRAGDARLDPRRRRTRLCAVARLWRGLRQSGSDRRLRRRRRRGRDRAAGDELALQQVPQSRRATARCCRSCTSTATRSPIRPCWRASRTTSSRRSSAATATSRTSSRATTRRRCTS